MLWPLWECNLYGIFTSCQYFFGIFSTKLQHTLIAEKFLSLLADCQTEEYLSRMRTSLGATAWVTTASTSTSASAVKETEGNSSMWVTGSENQTECSKGRDICWTKTWSTHWSFLNPIDGFLSFSSSNETFHRKISLLDSQDNNFLWIYGSSQRLRKSNFKLTTTLPEIKWEGEAKKDFTQYVA